MTGANHLRFFPFYDFIYLLQLEEYQNLRYFDLLSRFLFKKKIQVRGKLVHTHRAGSIFVLSVLVWLLLIYFWLPCILFSPLLIPFIIPLANMITAPYYSFVKKTIIEKARRLLIKNKPIVVLISGSYGKTTVKNFLYQILKHSYKTQMVSGNINSTIGIANWIINYLQHQTQILIAEADGYKLNRIAESTKLLAPSYSILTNIGDQHLERFKTIKNLTQSLMEVFDAAPANCKCITHADTKLPQPMSRLVIRVNEKHNLEHLSEVQNKNFELVYTVATLIGMEKKMVITRAKGLVAPARRQYVTTHLGFNAIDDSYNISYNTAIASLRHAVKLSDSSHLKLAVIIAGIPELAPNQKDKNIKLGQELSKVSDRVIVLNSVFANDIIEGVGFSKAILFDSLSQANQFIVNNLDIKEYFLLFFPELNDIYY